MKSHTAAARTTRKTSGDSSQHSSGGENAVAIAPPNYGIDFVDHGMAATAPVQRVGKPEEAALLPRQFVAIQRRGPDAAVQTKQPPSVPAQSQPEPKSPKNNTGLDDNLKAGIESLSGMSMDHVKVHYHSSQPAQLNALAYAQGTDIHVAPGQEKHIPHEAWHVVQQAQGRVKPTMQMKDGVPVNDDQGLEHEADVMGAKAGRSINIAEHSDEKLTDPEKETVQLKLFSWPNPILRAENIDSPSEGAAEVRQAAEEIDKGTEEGWRDVSHVITEYQLGFMSSDEVNNYLKGKGSEGHIRNFVNKLIDWGESKTAQKLGLVKTVGGSVIEDYATTKGKKIGAKSQSAYGTARPDFEICTGKNWPHPSRLHAANGFIDPTSKTEAEKGHTSGKLLKMNQDDARDHPHLYDSYYEDLSISTKKPQPTALEMGSKAYLERVSELARRVEQGKARKKSLRPGDKGAKFDGKAETLGKKKKEERRPKPY